MSRTLDPVPMAPSCGPISVTLEEGAIAALQVTTEIVPAPKVWRRRT